MKKNNVIPFKAKDPFTPDALKRWNKVPNWAQVKILENVFCGNCGGAVPIIMDFAKMENRDLIFKGKCKLCSKKVVRVVEPESD